MKRVEEQQPAEIITRAEELRKAQEAVRMAREAAASAEQQRLVAVKAADEAKQHAKTAGLSPSLLPNRVARDPADLTRTLQAELKRVGCDPGAVVPGALGRLRRFGSSAGSQRCHCPSMILAV